MATRCKFRCMGVGSRFDGGTKLIHSATFAPVIDGSAENKAFFAYTPGGKLELDVMNGQQFEAGKEYYVDLTLVGDVIPAN